MASIRVLHVYRSRLEKRWRTQKVSRPCPRSVDWQDSCDGSEWTRLFRVTINIVRATRRTLSRSGKIERDFCERRGATSERRVGRKERKWGGGETKGQRKGRALVSVILSTLGTVLAWTRSDETRRLTRLGSKRCDSRVSAASLSHG